MKTGRSLLAGLAGALAMTVAMASFRWAGAGINFEAMLGGMLIDGQGTSRWLAGFGLHLAIGVVAALLYAAAFEFATQRAGALIGGGIGLSHGLLAGLFMSGIPEMNSAPREFLLFVLMHVLFGAVVGLVYGEPLQKPHPAWT